MFFHNYKHLLVPKKQKLITVITIITFCFSSCFYDLLLAGNVYAQQTNVGIENMNSGIGNYEKGEYQYAIVNFNMALTQIPEHDKENLWKTHFYLGLSFYLIGENEESNREFKKAKGILENKKPDQEIYSPKIVSLFNKIKVEPKEEISTTASKPGETQLHEKWWFWAIVGGIGYAFYSASKSGGNDGDSGDEETVIIRW